MKHPGFFITFYRVCTEVSVFRELATVPFWKALKDFILMTMLCGIAVLAFRYFSVNSSVARFSDAISSEFSQIDISKNGITPLKDPDRQRTLIVGTLRIDYVPASENAKELELEGGVADRGLIWTPKSLVEWHKGDGSDLYYSSLVFSKQKNLKGKSREIMKFAWDNPFPESFLGNLSAVRISFNHAVLVTLALLMLSAYVFLVMMVFVPMISFFMTVFMFLSGGDGTLGLKFTNLLQLALYASFPGMLIGSLFFALDLQFIEFQTVTFICFIAYFLYVLSSLQKKPGPKQEEADYDEF